MKIKNVVIVNDFNYVQGGASKVAIDTAILLKESGVKVYFFSAVCKEEEKIEGIEYITTNQTEALKDKNKLKAVINGIYNFKVRKELKKLLKKLDNNDTLIHVHGWTKALSSSVFDISFKMKFKVVLTLHDYFTACPNGGYFNYKENAICKLNPLSLKCIKCNCDSRNYVFKLYRVLRHFVQNKIVKLNDKLKYVISISDFSEKILKTTLSKNIKIYRIYNPIEIDINEEKVDASKNKYYLYVGRVSKEKGVDIFCQTITELGIKGIVVGEGDERENLEKKYTNIEFTGWKNKYEVKQYMKGARVLVFPSRWYETAGLTILEAQALGIPVLVNNVCAGVEFITEGKNGYTFSNINELKEKINQLQNLEKNICISQKYTKQEYCNSILKLYNKIIGNKRG